MPYVIKKVNGKPFTMHTVFTREEIERVAAKDCVVVVNTTTRRTEMLGRKCRGFTPAGAAHYLRATRRK